MTKNLKICYFGTYSTGEEYARNNAIIAGLRANGVEVIPCQTDVFPTHEQKMKAVGGGLVNQGFAFLRAYLRLAGAYLDTPYHDFVFVGYIGHIDMFPARLLAWMRGRPIVFDTFYSLYDTIVEDRGLYARGSGRARLLRIIDRWSCRLADLSLLDTWQHVDYYAREFRLDRSGFLSIPLGTDEKNFYPREWPAEDGVLDVISYSSYIPLHGIDVQLDAAARLKDRSDIRFTFVGKGQLYPEMRARAEAAGLANVKFIEWIPHAELVELIARADVCLGIFGRTEKAARVIPYKAYEALAMRKPLITGDSPASRDGLVNGETALLTPMGDPDGLAAAIARLAGDEGLRRKISEGGHAFFSEKCTSRAMGEAILAELRKRWPEKFNG